MMDKSDSTLRRDMQTGKVSYTKDDNGKVLFDTVELARAYGKLNMPDISPPDNAASPFRSHEIRTIFHL